MLALYLGLIRDYLAHGYCIYISSTWLCRLHSFLFYFALDFSSWILVAVSIDRFLAITFVFSSDTRNILLKVMAKPKLVCTFIGTSLIILNLHFLFYIDSIDSHKFQQYFTLSSSNSNEIIGLADSCFSIGVSNEYSSCVINSHRHPQYSNFFQNTWPHIDLSVYAIAPFIIMSVCNVAMIKNAKFLTPSFINHSKKNKLKALFCCYRVKLDDKSVLRCFCNNQEIVEEKRYKNSLANEETSQSEYANAINNLSKESRKASSVLFTRLSFEGNSRVSQSRNIRMMTLTISSITCIFIILTLPVVLFIVIEKITIEMNGNSAHGNETLIDEAYSFLAPDNRAVVWSILNILMYVNHSINFVLYCLTGSKFRAELATLIVSEKKLAKLNMQQISEYPLNSQIANKFNNTNIINKNAQCNKKSSIRQASFLKFRPKSIFCGSTT